MQIELYRGYQIRLMFWDESFFVCWRKKEMKLKKLDNRNQEKIQKLYQ